MIKTNILKTLLNSFQHHCPSFFKPITKTETCFNNYKKKYKISIEATSNLMTHLKRPSNLLWTTTISYLPNC